MSSLTPRKAAVIDGMQYWVDQFGGLGSIADGGHSRCPGHNSTVDIMAYEYGQWTRRTRKGMREAHRMVLNVQLHSWLQPNGRRAPAPGSDPSSPWTNSHWPSEGWVGRHSRRPEAQLDGRFVRPMGWRRGGGVALEGSDAVAGEPNEGRAGPARANHKVRCTPSTGQELGLYKRAFRDVMEPYSIPEPGSEPASRTGPQARGLLLR